MFKRIVFEDNEDGTTTVTCTTIDGQEITMLFEFGLEQLAGLLPPEMHQHANELLKTKVTLVPDSLED